MRTFFAIALIVASLALLELARKDVAIVHFDVGQTPVTGYARQNAEGPIVVVAHGFAGSQQMMQGYALPLARAGYRVFVFEFLGHGRHPAPMSGDVTRIDGTTRLLMEQTGDVIDAVTQTPTPGDQKVALLGHSMATDILVRVAAERTDVGPLVLISAFSQEITGTAPDRLLLITGAWEPGLRAFATRALQMVATGAAEGQTVTNDGIVRRTVVAPFSEHVSVLHSRVGRRAALDWLDLAYARRSDVTILPSGWAILGLLGGLVLAFRGVAGLLPQRDHAPADLSMKELAIVCLTPAILTPLVAVPLSPAFLPVLVADYLVLHLLIFGVIQLLLLRKWGVVWRGVSWPAYGLLMLWCVLFGVGLDRYAANFWPTSGRLWIIAAMIIGTVPYMMSDSILTTRTSFWRRLGVRTSFLLSLGIAVALDFEGLFFLIMIAPVLILFYLVFGTMGRQAANRSGPLSSGIGLGLALAWAIGVSFPLFQV